MTVSIARVIEKMIRYNAGDPRRVQHALKVYAFAKSIGELEGLPAPEQEILEASAVLHDIGIRSSEQKYHSSAGNYQEQEGPPVARELLAEFQLPPEFLDRVCFLIGHHHTYSAIDGLDYQILIEADFLVNAYEDELSPESAKTFFEKYFRTEAGREYFAHMYEDRRP